MSVFMGVLPDLFHVLSRYLLDVRAFQEFPPISCGLFLTTSQWEGIGPPENEGGEKPESLKMQQNMQRVQT